MIWALIDCIAFFLCGITSSIIQPPLDKSNSYSWADPSDFVVGCICCVEVFDLYAVA